MWASSGEIGSFFVSLRVGCNPVIIDPLLPAAMLRTHGCRCIVQTVSNRAFSIKAVAFNWYRQTPCRSSTGARRDASGRHKLDTRQRALAGGRSESA